MDKIQALHKNRVGIRKYLTDNGITAEEIWDIYDSEFNVEATPEQKEEIKKINK